VLPPLDPSTTDAPALAGLLAGAGLIPITIFGGHSLESDVRSVESTVRAAGLSAMRQALDLTAALGGSQMNGVPYGIFGHPAAPTLPDAFARSAREVGAAADYAHSLGLTMTFEVLNRYETSVVNTAAQAMEYVRQSESDHLYIHLDTFHMAIEEADMLAAISHALPKLGYLELGQSGRGSLSTGAVDVVEVVRHAMKAGYTGLFGVEAFSRSILPEFLSDAIAIWRETYSSGSDLAAEAAQLIRTGLELSHRN
jgi:D-psicose/D-tagatose/L-ribulose 3-epimerase